MLGAEGVKRAVIGRLRGMMPVALATRRHVTGATLAELPEVNHYFPTASIKATSDMFPLCTVTVEGTNGELSNEVRGAGSIVMEFEMEYVALVRFHAAVTSQEGDALARRQVERLALAGREALLGDTQLLPDTPGQDQAEVHFERWAEEYDVNGDPDAGLWEAQAGLYVPIRATEYLDRGPYIAAREAVLKSWNVDQLPTGTAFPPKSA